MFVAVVRGERNDCFLLSCMIFLSRKIHLELLQCFLYLEIHCSNLKKKKNWKSFAFGELVGANFLGFVLQKIDLGAVLIHVCCVHTFAAMRLSTLFIFFFLLSAVKVNFSTVNSAFVHCSWTHKFHFLSIFH